MNHNQEIQSQSKPVSARPRVTSYDSGHEYSIEHWNELRLMVEESAEETAAPDTARGFAAKA